MTDAPTFFAAGVLIGMLVYWLSLWVNWGAELAARWVVTL
jgi:hypothetical protein